MKKKVCLVCAKEFSVDNWRVGRAKYCGYACAIKGRTTKKSYDKPRKCVGCGGKFIPTQWYQKFCGRKCFTTSVKKRKRALCISCGKEFAQTRVAQKYCSRKCGEPQRIKSVGKFRKNYTDIQWANLVKLIAGEKCEFCGKAEHLNSHHIFSRSNLTLRWKTENGVCLCVGHHVFGNMSAHKAPIEFLEWLKEKRGLTWYEDLRVASRVISKLTTEQKLQITEGLKQKIKELEDERKKIC